MFEVDNLELHSPEEDSILEHGEHNEDGMIKQIYCAAWQ